MEVELILLIVMLAATCLSIIAIIMAMLPNKYSRQIRHALAGFVMWQWKKGSRASAVLHALIWRKGNGNGKEPEDLDKYL